MMGVASGSDDALSVLLQKNVVSPSNVDKIGLDLLVRACYDPREAPDLWERMGQIGGGQRPPEWMSTHPASETRAENFRKWMPEAIAEYERRCEPLG